jgi:hypothetical protein
MALAETRIILLVRGVIGEVEVDATCYGRFYDRLICNDGQWKIKERTPIYEKDALYPVDPGQLLHLDQAELGRYPEPYRHLAYLQAAGGASITLTIPLPNSDSQNRLYALGQSWLLTNTA